MKKVLFYVSSALLVAAMSVSCANKNAEETADTTAMSTEAPAEEAVAAEATNAVAAEAAVTDAEAIAAGKEAGRAKCECYKKDAASVESCIRSLIKAQYAKYEGNTAFVNAMDAEYKACIKEKATAAATEAGNAALKEGSKALSNALNKKK